MIIHPRNGRPCHPPETIIHARALWMDGYSINEIGRRMGVTRNVVVGIAFRNDFPPRPSPIGDGEANAKAKLSASEVIAIRDALATGVRQCVLSQLFSVDPSTVGDIASGRTWKSV